MNTENNPKFYGPRIPTNITNSEVISTLGETNAKEYDSFGPQLPPHMRAIVCEKSDIADNINDEIVGPFPSTDVSDRTIASQIELSTRALNIKLKNIEGDSNSKMSTREEWMLELPEINKCKDVANLPKSFQTKERPDFTDRTCWTNTPNSKSTDKKSLSKKEIYKRNISIERDKDQDALAKKHKRAEKERSLLEIHEKKMEKERKKKQAKTERRPFNRDIDIQVNNFDPTKKSRLVKNALLDTKFSTGKTKYL